MKLICASAAAVLLMTPGLPSPAVQTAGPPALGLVRPDGILLPVAVFDSGQWLDPWPALTAAMPPDRMLETLPSFWRKRGQQVPQTWHVAEGPEAPLTPANVTTHLLYGEHCGNQPGLLTDLPRATRELPRRRLAMSRQAPFSLPLAMDAADPAWKPLLAHVSLEVARQEAATIAREEKHLNRRSELEALPDRQPLRMRKLLGHQIGTARTLYYEAERRYTKPMFAGAKPARLVASGWVHLPDGQQASVLHRHALIGSPTSTAPQTIAPLAVLTIDGATFWVVVEHGYESETFSIVQPGPGGVRRVLTKLIGGC